MSQLELELLLELELGLIQPHMAQKPVLRGEVGCACVAREVSVERGGMGELLKSEEEEEGLGVGCWREVA